MPLPLKQETMNLAFNSLTAFAAGLRYGLGVNQSLVQHTYTNKPLLRSAYYRGVLHGQHLRTFNDALQEEAPHAG
jgi:hypothetical protein